MSGRARPRPAAPSLLLAAALACVTRLAAQAPRVTPAGDPSVRSDTIYKLAVDPGAHPEEDAYFLLDDGAVRLETDGRYTATFRQVVQVLKPDAVGRMAEEEFSYAPKHERLTINWVRVVRPNGTVVSAKPTHVQDADVPADLGDPVYSDRRVRRISLTGVAPGTIVDYSYTREELKPFLPGDYFQSWGVSTGLGVRRSRFVVDAPASLALRVREENLAFARRTDRVNTAAGPRVVYTWATRDLPRLKAEPYAADSTGVYQAVYVAAPVTWQGIGAWYAGNARGRYALGPAASARLAEALKPARTRDDSVRAVHKWVAQDVRYVSIALGMGGYRPRTPDEVVRTGYGDCKDKATLFVAALGAMGVTAYPVVLNAAGGVKRDLPSIEQLNHAIAAVPVAGSGSAGDGYQFVDLTAKFTPYGELPYAEQGAFGMVVKPDGATEVVTLPLAPVEANNDSARIAGTLAPDGTFEGRYEEVVHGALGGVVRSAFEHPLDTAQQRQVANALAARYFENAEGDSLRYTPGLDLAAAPRIAVHIRNGHAATPSGGTMILKLPLPNMAGMAQVARELEREPVRRFPIDAVKVMGPGVAVSELRVQLPPGWHAQLPPTVRADGPFGSYATEYAEEDGALRVTRRVRGARGIYPPTARPELAAWMRAVAKDDATFVVLTKPAPPAGQ